MRICGSPCFFAEKFLPYFLFSIYIYVIQRLVCPNFQSQVLCKSVAECSCRLLLVLDVKINTSIKHSKSIWRVAYLLNEVSSELLIKSNGSLPEYFLNEVIAAWLSEARGLQSEILVKSLTRFFESFRRILCLPSDAHLKTLTFSRSYDFSLSAWFIIVHLKLWGKTFGCTSLKGCPHKTVSWLL